MTVIRDVNIWRKAAVWRHIESSFWKPIIHMESLDDFVLKEENLISKFHIGVFLWKTKKN